MQWTNGGEEKILQDNDQNIDKSNFQLLHKTMVSLENGKGEGGGYGGRCKGQQENAHLAFVLDKFNKLVFQIMLRTSK